MKPIDKIKAEVDHREKISDFASRLLNDYSDFIDESDMQRMIEIEGAITLDSQDSNKLYELIITSMLTIDLMRGKLQDTADTYQRLTNTLN